MHRILTALAAVVLLCSAAYSQQAYVVELGPDTYVGIVLNADGTVSPISALTIIKPGPPEPPDDEPTGPGQLICIRPWSCTLDESDADLTIRESLDAAMSKVPYIRVLPDTLDQRMQPHSVIEAYRKLVPDKSKAWVFHVQPTASKPRITHQGPLDAETVLAWVDVPKMAFAIQEEANEERWLDVDFKQENAQLAGMMEPPAWLQAWFRATATNVRNLSGFEPIPRSQWSQWTARFPVERRAKSIRHISEQVMGSCVGHSCGNGVEGASYHMAGDLFFRRLSFMSMYHRIGRSPNSGAYVGDAADEIFERGILPADGETNIDGDAYSHTHQVSGGFYDSLPTGWESTAAAWKCKVFEVTDEESAFRILMDCRLRTHFGRSSHAISGFAVTARGSWAYENSWGDDWGDLGKSVGYDSRFYDSYTYQPVLRDEIKLLEAKELDQRQPMLAESPRADKPSAHLEAYRHFDELLKEQRRKLDEIIDMLKGDSPPEPSEGDGARLRDEVEQLKVWSTAVDRQLVNRGIIRRSN